MLNQKMHLWFILTPFLHTITTTTADFLSLLVFLEPVKKSWRMYSRLLFLKSCHRIYQHQTSQSHGILVVNVCCTVPPLSVVLLLLLPLNLLLHRLTSLAQSHSVSHTDQPFTYEIEFYHKSQTTEAVACLAEQTLSEPNKRMKGS